MLLVILALAFALRLYRLGGQSLWYDETVSVHLASKSLAGLVAHTAGDIHPPGYYLLLAGWIRLAGSGEFSAAFLSLTFGLLLVALVARLAASIAGRRAGTLAALLVAVSPFNLWYSQELRMYTLGAALGLGLLFALIPLLERPAEPPPWSRLALYAVCGALGLWVLYYFAFLLLALNLAVVVWWLLERRRVGVGWLARWALAQAAILLLYAPWLPVLWRQATEPPVPPWRGFTPLGSVALQTWSALSLGQSADPRQVWPVLVLVALLFALGLVARRASRAARQRASGLAWLLACYSLLPVFLIHLASYAVPLYHVRYAFTYSPPFYAVVALGLDAIGRRWRAVQWCVLALLLAFSGASIAAYHGDARFAADDHRAAVRFLAERWRPGDAIVVDAGYVYTALLYYWDGDPIAWRGRLGAELNATGRGPVVVQAGTIDGPASLGWGDPDSDFYALSRADTEAALTGLFERFHRVWLYRCYDTVTDPQGLIRDWLSAHGTQFEDRPFTGEAYLRVQGYLTGRDPLDGAVRPPGGELVDGTLRLVSSSVETASVAVGGSLDLELVWQVGAQPAGDATLFAGLFDDSAGRWAQTDEHPLGSLYQPPQWPVGRAVRTPLRLSVPPGTPPGIYRLEVGWYRFVDGQPVWLAWTEGNLLYLGQVEVTAPRDWWALPVPGVAHSAGVTIGPGARLLGFSAPSLVGRPGEALPVELIWQALDDRPEAGAVVLRLLDHGGYPVAEQASVLASGRADFSALAAGQSVRDPQLLSLSPGLPAGQYQLTVGRRRADGSWHAVRRGLFGLGSAYPLATVRVLPASLGR